MKVSDYILDFLVLQDIHHIFEVCGGSLAHILDSLYERKDIATISMHHEMAASIAAEGYSRVSDSIGVAMATSGPGATNLITGIGSCYFDSIPCLFITGQVNTYEFKFSKPTRQIGFQETDIVNIVRPITKKAELVVDEKSIRYCLEEAISLAEEGRPGPVLLDIPLNIQRANIDPDLLIAFNKDSLKNLVEIDEKEMDQVRDLIKSAHRPIILVGGGIRLSKCQDQLLRFAHNTGIPVVTSLMGLDAFPHNDPLFVGMIGTYGNRYANLAIANSDLVLALGTRLDTRQTGTKPDTFARSAKIIHVDIDPVELNDKIKVAKAINCDLNEFLMRLDCHTINYDRAKLDPWREIIRRYKEKYPAFSIPTREAIEPNYFLHMLSEVLPKDAIICVDVGQNQMWSAQSLELSGSQRFLTQGGMASMGCALPMAIGASFAKPGKPVVVIAGDGGFQLNIQELQTVYHHNLPIKIILINNRCYGMVKQFQEQYFNGRYQSKVIGYSNPDFQSVVNAYKILSSKIAHNDEINASLEKLFSDMQPRFLEVNIYTEFKVIPKLSVNRPVEDQDPILSRNELKSNMIIDILPEPENI